MGSKATTPSSIQIAVSFGLLTKSPIHPSTKCRGKLKMANPASRTDASVWLSPFQTIIGMKWVVTVVNAAERAIIDTTNIQKIRVLIAWRVVMSASLWASVWRAASGSSFFALCSGSPSGPIPMLSGDRRTPKHNGRPTTRKSVPDMNAAQRHPHRLTAIARSGVMMAPPTGTAALTTVIARARRRINQVLATIAGA